jgi:hypothetical protein
MRTFVLAALALLLVGGFSSPASAEVSFNYFYSSLSPHGSWLVSARYGRVWQPSAYTPGWNPYLDGHWVYSDLGWTWVSDYAWGADTYHYGTWAQDPSAGWVWVPGYTWAPSWVVFRTGPDYIGWAPVSPGFSVGVSVGAGAPASGAFLFVSSRNFLAPRVRAFAVPEARTRVILDRTTIVNTNITIEKNVVVNRGFNPAIVERACGRHVHTVPIEQVSRVASGPRFERSQIYVDPARAGRGYRAAEPVSPRSPLPVAGRHEGVERRREPEAAAMDGGARPRGRDQEDRKGPPARGKARESEGHDKDDH